MAYSKQTWNSNDPATPLSSSRLNHIEDGIEAVEASIPTEPSDIGAAPANHTHAPDRVMYGAGWPAERPEDNGLPLHWDDTALAATQGSNTTGPPEELLEPGDYWWTIIYEEA